MLVGDYWRLFWWRIYYYIRIGVPLTRRDKLEKVTKKFPESFMTFLPKALITTKRSPPNVLSQVFRSRFRVCDLAGLNRPLLQPMRGISQWKKNAPERSVEIDSAATPLLILLPFNAFFLGLLHDTHIIHICMQYAWFYYVSYFCLSQVDDFGYWWNVVQYVQACHTVPLKRGSTWLNNFWYSRPGLLSYTSTLSAQGAFIIIIDNVALWCLESW